MKYCLLVTLLIAIAACSDNGSSQNQWAQVPLPDISNQPITLSVASVVNPRFKQLTDSQINKILQRSQQLVKQNFDIEIRFSTVESLSITQVFDRLDSSVITNRQDEIVDISLIDETARERMRQSLFKTLSNYAANEKNVIAFAQPYLLNSDVPQKNFTELSAELINTLISRLTYWEEQLAPDGLPVLSSDKFHEWVWWDSLGYSDLSFDVLITNQLVASAEYYAMDVHSTIRGGITAGTTTYNKNTASNTYAYIMVYPMLNNTDLLSVLRDDENYSETQIINYSAALLTHELGHLLLHLGHPFGNKNCIMSPTMMLNYRYWYDNLDAKNCPVGSSNEMQPGAAKIEYNRHW